MSFSCRDHGWYHLFKPCTACSPHIVTSTTINVGSRQVQIEQELEECKAAHDFQVKLNKELQELLKQTLPEIEQRDSKIAIAVEALRKIEAFDKAPNDADLSDWLYAWRCTTKLLARQALEKIEGEIK